MFSSGTMSVRILVLIMIMSFFADTGASRFAVLRSGVLKPLCLVYLAVCIETQLCVLRQT